MYFYGNCILHTSLSGINCDTQYLNYLHNKLSNFIAASPQVVSSRYHSDELGDVVFDFSVSFSAHQVNIASIQIQSSDIDYTENSRNLLDKLLLDNKFLSFIESNIVNLVTQFNENCTHIKHPKVMDGHIIYYGSKFYLSVDDSMDVLLNIDSNVSIPNMSFEFTPYQLIAPVSLEPFGSSLNLHIAMI